jgi:hypothetical protein
MSPRGYHRVCTLDAVAVTGRRANGILYAIASVPRNVQIKVTFNFTTATCYTSMDSSAVKFRHAFIQRRSIRRNDKSDCALHALPFSRHNLISGHQPLYTMRLSILFTSLVVARGGLAACGWKLQPNDCICMNSVDGSLEKVATATCCQDMGLKNIDNVSNEIKISTRQLLTPWQICGTSLNTRQTFKDCCKWLNQTSVIGHCR